jgi:uncharacterized protein (DUF2267 family)
MVAATERELIDLVEHETHLPPEQAERALRATLKTLGERISGGEARDLAQELPRSVASELYDGETAEPFDIGEFLRRVSKREGVDRDEAREHARAVFAALGFAIDPKEIRDMVAQLPSDYAPLVEAAVHPRVPPPPEPPAPRKNWSTEKIVARVAERAGIDDEPARRAIEATLETLAERISAGQARDLEGWLPRDLRPPIERTNRRRKNDHPEPFPVDVFITRVAKRAGVDYDEARAQARAAFATLREAVSEKEFADTLAQLPRDYRDELVGP